MSRSRRTDWTGLALLLAFAYSAHGQDASMALPGTRLLTIEEPLDEVMVAGISRHALSTIAESRSQRHVRWLANFGSAEQYNKHIEESRKRLQSIIGAVDSRLPADGFELVAKWRSDGVVAQSSDFVIYSIRWPVLDGASAEGLLIEPREPAVARVVAIPDADWTPEMFAGMVDGIGEHEPIARRLAENRIQVVVPVLISRDDTYSGNEAIGLTNQPHREFIYRQAFQMGRHIIGYEVQKVLAAVEQFTFLNERDDVGLPIGVVGVGEGGLLGLHAAAIDQRIKAAMISGYFQARERIWEEPIYRNVWALLTDFGDAELAGMIAPRPLVIETCAVPEVGGPRPLREGRREVAAPGRIKTCPLSQVHTEYDQAHKYYEALHAADKLIMLASDEGDGPSGSDRALATFHSSLEIANRKQLVDEVLKLTSQQIDPSARQRRQVQELTDHTQQLMRRSEKVRDELWSKASRSSVEEWTHSTGIYRDLFWEEVVGKLPPPSLPPNVRTRKVIDDDAYAGYEIVMDVYPNVIAAGILLLPKSLQELERRPLIICQHGLEGTPRDTITIAGEAYQYYKSFAAELARRGFIVYAPQNPYRGGDQFRILQRQANPIKLSIFSYIIRQHERTIDWLATLPNVDPDRIGFYGLSYGGKTAMRVPPLLEGRFAVCICSGDFNDWIRKIATVDDAHSYVRTGEYEMPEWNMAHIASYAELASLMMPRPFMVERGHKDGVAPDEWVASEYAKVERLYDEFGLGDRTEIEFFNGPHTIHGAKTYEFLHKQLKWPAHKPR